MRQTLSRFAGPVYVQRMTAKDSGKKGADLLSPEHRVERAAGDLRRGAPVLIGSARAGESAVVVAAETVSDATLTALCDAIGRPALVLTHARAATLKIRLYTPDAVAINLPETIRTPDLRAIADPTADLDFPLKGPFEAVRDALPESAAASVHLAKLAGLLPAAAVFRVTDAQRDRLVPESALSVVSVADIAG